jgi:hypothetical protein
MAAVARPVLLYDSGCRFCRFTARVAVTLDRRGRLAVLPLTDAAATPLLAALPEDERLASWRLVRRDGALLGYGGMRGRVPDGLYRLVARHRGLLGRLVPDGPAPRRFP